MGLKPVTFAGDSLNNATGSISMRGDPKFQKELSRLLPALSSEKNYRDIKEALADFNKGWKIEDSIKIASSFGLLGNYDISEMTPKKAFQIIEKQVNEESEYNLEIEEAMNGDTTKTKKNKKSAMNRKKMKVKAEISPREDEVVTIDTRNSQIKIGKEITYNQTPQKTKQKEKDDPDTRDIGEEETLGVGEEEMVGTGDTKTEVAEDDELDTVIQQYQAKLEILKKRKADKSLKTVKAIKEFLVEHSEYREEITNFIVKLNQVEHNANSK